MVRKSLDKDVETLSAELKHKLAHARMGAVESATPNNKFNNVLSLFFNQPTKVAMAVASLTFVAVLTFPLINLHEENTIKKPQETLTENEQMDIDVVNADVGKDFFLTEEDLDFFDNLELYQWLDSEFKAS